MVDDAIKIFSSMQLKTVSGLLKSVLTTHRLSKYVDPHIPEPPQQQKFYLTRVEDRWEEKVD